MAVFVPADLTNGYSTVTALTPDQYVQLVYDGWVPVDGPAQLEPYFERYISRDGATAGQVAVLQADGSITFQTVAGGGGGGVTSVNGQTGVVVLGAADVGAATTAHTHAELTSATDAATGDTLVRRTAGGSFTGATIRATAAPVDPSDLTRMDYVDAGDTAAKARANHTGTQAAATISDLTEVVQDIVGALIVAGTNTTVSYNDAAGTFTINATASGGTTDPEVVRDTIGGALVAGSGIQITVNDAGDTITIASTAVLPTRQVIAGTGLSGGGDLSADRTLAVTYGTTAGTAVQGNDSRLAAASTAASGIVELADDTEAAAGTSNAVVMTPARTKIARRQQVTARTAAHTAAAADVEKLITMTHAATATVTLPSDANDAGIAIGDWIEYLQLGAGQTTFTAGAGVSALVVPTGATAACRGTNCRVVVQKIAANTYALAGDLA